MLRREFLETVASAATASTTRTGASVSLAVWPTAAAEDELDDATRSTIATHARRAFGAAFDAVDVTMGDVVPVPPSVSSWASGDACEWWARQRRGTDNDANLLLLSDANCSEWELQGYAFYDRPYGVLRGASDLPARPFLHCLLHELGHCFDLRHEHGSTVERRYVTDRRRTGPRTPAPASRTLYDVETRTLETIMGDTFDYDGYALEFSEAAIEELQRY